MSQVEVPEPNIDKLAVSDIDRFANVLKYLHQNKLLGKAEAHLKQRGFYQFKISVEPFREMQRFLREQMTAGKVAQSPQGNSLIMCGKGNASC